MQIPIGECTPFQNNRRIHEHEQIEDVPEKKFKLYFML